MCLLLRHRCTTRLHQGETVYKPRSPNRCSIPCTSVQHLVTFEPHPTIEWQIQATCDFLYSPRKFKIYCKRLLLVLAKVYLQTKFNFWACELISTAWVNVNSIRPKQTISTNLSPAYRDFDLRFHRDENSERGTKPSLTSWKSPENPLVWAPFREYFAVWVCKFWSVSSVPSCWNIAFCYIQLWYHVYCNDHFFELSAHLTGELGVHCFGLLLSLSFVAPLLEKWACELSTVDESLWLHVNNCVPIGRSGTQSLYSIWSPSNRLSFNWCLLQCTGYTRDRLAYFELHPTFPVLVGATWIIFETKIENSKNWWQTL